MRLSPQLDLSVIKDLTWFHEVLSEKGNMSHMEFLDYIESSGRMSLKNFTESLELVVYPQCLVSLMRDRASHGRQHPSIRRSHPIPFRSIRYTTTHTYRQEATSAYMHAASTLIA